ncbi:MAG: hypothetical protein Q8N58_01650 [bacterium]|nr:hypothetical protein [bacterium]
MAEKQGEVLAVGELTLDKIWQILKSAKSAVTNGEHLILHVLNQTGEILNHSQISCSEKRKAFSTLMIFAQKQRPNGRWIITLNGPGLTTRPAFHIHAICLGKEDKVLRIVFNADDFCKRLRDCLKFQEPDNPQEIFHFKDKITGFIEELEKNLK